MINKGTGKDVIKNVAWLLFDKGFMLLISFFVTIKIANYYGASDYGMYQYAVSVITVLDIFITLVDARVVKKKYLKHDPNEVVFIATLSRVVLAALSFILGTIFLFAYNGDKEFNILFIVLLANVVIADLKFGMANRFEYLLESKKVVIASDISTGIGAVLQLLAVHFGMSVLYLSVIALIVSAINLSTLYLQYKIEFGNILVDKINIGLLKEIVRESLPLAIAASCAIVYTRCDSVMIGTLMASSDVGIYAIALKLVSIAQIPLGPIRESVYPGLIATYNSDHKGYEKRYIRISSILTWICILGAMVSFAIVPLFLGLLNQEYAAAFGVYKVLIIGTLFMYNAGLRAGHYTLVGRGNILMYTQIVSVFVNALLNYICINALGMYGAALATAITLMASLMFSNLFFGKDGIEVFKWQIKAINPMRIFNK